MGSMLPARQVPPYGGDTLFARNNCATASAETTILGKRQGQRVVYLQLLEGPHPIRYSARPGENVAAFFHAGRDTLRWPSA